MKRSLDNASIRPHEMKFRSWEQNKDPKSIGKRRHKLEANHDGLHTNDGIQWRGYSGLSHEGSWSYMKIFEICVKSSK
jgi:hypothetical protein